MSGAPVLVWNLCSPRMNLITLRSTLLAYKRYLVLRHKVSAVVAADILEHLPACKTYLAITPSSYIQLFGHMVKTGFLPITKIYPGGMADFRILENHRTWSAIYTTCTYFSFFCYVWIACCIVSGFRYCCFTWTITSYLAIKCSHNRKRLSISLPPLVYSFYHSTPIAAQWY